MPVKILIVPKKLEPTLKGKVLPTDWPADVIVKIQNAGDHALAIVDLLSGKWKKYHSEVWKLNATLELSIDAKKVSWKWLGVTEPQKEAILALASLVKEAKSTGPMMSTESLLTEVVERAEESENAPTPKKQKAMTSWTVFEHDDISRLFADRDLVERRLEGKMPIDVVIDDKDILEKLADAKDMPLVIQQVKGAADFKRIAKDCEALLAKVDELLTEHPKKLAAAQKKYEEGLETIVGQAAERAIAAVEHFKQVRQDYRKYRVKAGVKMTISILGAGAGIAGLATAPFTGAGAVLGTIALAKSVLSIADQIATLSREAEGIAKDSRKMVESLAKQFHEHATGIMSMKEIGVETLTGLSGIPSNLLSRFAPCLATIKSTADKLGLLNDKTNGIEVNAQDLSKKLSKLLDSNAKSELELGVWLRKRGGLESLKDKEKKQVGKMVQKIRGGHAAVELAIGKTTDLYERMAKNRMAYMELHDILKPLAESLPTAVHVMARLFPAAGNIALSLGAFAISDFSGFQDVTKLANEISGLSGVILDEANVLMEFNDGLESLIGAVSPNPSN